MAISGNCLGAPAKDAISIESLGEFSALLPSSVNMYSEMARTGAPKSTIGVICP